MKSKYVLGLLIGAVGLFFLYSLLVKEEKIDFNTQVRPILNKNCLTCHGGVRQQSDLSFLFMKEALRPAKSGKKAIVPGHPAQSELIQRITSNDPDKVMPPDKNPLNKAEVEILEKWIAQGAQWEKHWAYRSPTPSPSTSTNKKAWCVNEIDQHVLATLQTKDLSPSEKASKTTLIRRLSLDLIGLPPTLEETQQFLTDDSPTAYEKLVDRLLVSPHFGERWASVWLDLARYADSKGYQKDLLRKDIWRYRDWVIDAFNKDMPFDQFTIEQLAGDLLPSPNDNQLLATAFHRNTMTNDEGGTDDEEFRVAAVLDRLNTTFEIWQGTTMACVQCHSHPYDPIRHEDFYHLYAFFNNTKDTDNGRDSPLKSLYSPAQKRAKAALKKQLADFQQIGDTLSEKYQSKVQAFLAIQPGKVQIMEELPADSSRKTHLFERGNWLVHGQQVHPKTPGYLPPISKAYPANRLGLAKWLVDGKNPLTARVIVNRFWEQIFGNGLVTTLEDFGTQGDKPSHPALLDQLALTFVEEHQWRVKSLLKQIVLSNTYQQTSKVTAALLEKDPYNKYLARSPRYRLSAEAIRDQALRISGLFNPTLFGPSVMPYQPEGVWNVIRHAARWEKDTTGQQYRRAIYTFWRRVSPYPSMLTFDVPSRELCVSRRIRTNTPLQALVTLNDPVYVEAASALATRMIKDGGATVDKQIQYGFQLTLLRTPDETTLNNLIDFYHTTVSKQQQLSAAKAQFINQTTDKTNLQAMEQVASVLLNLDEVLMRN